MEQKLSSLRTMSEAPLATSVPWTPIATPTSAWFSAGASPTPPPVMAVTNPWRCKDFTISSLSSGRTPAKTWTEAVSASISRLGRYSPLGRKAAQSTAAAASSSPSRKICTFFALAIAVVRDSPVIMTTRMPAPWATPTDSLTPSRSESIAATRPTQITETEPNVSTAANLRTNTFFVNMSLQAVLSESLTHKGMHSGMAATATVTASASMYNQLAPSGLDGFLRSMATPTTKSNTEKPIARRPIRTPNASKFCCICVTLAELSVKQA
mmetsp:Transcript_81088/g.247796  ORF Transcript_81088/g.247796 Transcript_81088/m.247796 type:complete len:268 (-) Transcript_81088:748-1551(-)